MSQEFIQKQILYKAIKEPVFAKETFVRVPTTSFNKEKSYTEIALIINRYYQTNNVPLDKETLLVMVEDKLTKTNANADKQQDFYRVVNDLYTIDPYEQNEDVINESIQKYIRKTLIQQTLLREVGNGNLEDEAVVNNLIAQLQDIAIMNAGSGGETINFFRDGENKKELLTHMNKNKFKTGFTAIDEIADGGLSRGELGLILAPYGGGKALTNSTSIKTPKGDIAIGSLQVGDEVFGTDGKAHNILGVFPQGALKVYEVEFSDGTVVECNDEHLWTYQTRSQRGDKKDKWVTRSLKHIIENEHLLTNQGTPNLYIPMAEPVEYSSKDLPIDPYVLGALIGDGSFRQKFAPYFTNSEKDIISRMNKALALDNLQLQHRTKNKNNEYSVQWADKDQYASEVLGTVRPMNPIKAELTHLGLWGKKSEDKFVPKQYMQGSIDQRLGLIQGLIDTDGYARNGSYEYTTKSPQLALDVQELVTSLGGTAQIRTKEVSGVIYQRVTIKAGDTIRLLHSSNKHQSQYTGGQFSAYRQITDIRETDQKVDMTCISVDSADKLFLTTNYVATHNTTWAVNLVRNYVMQGLNVLFIPLEEKLDRMVLRFEQVFSQQSKSVLMAGGVLNETLYDNLQEAYDKLINPEGQKGWGEFIISKHMPRTLSPTGLEQLIVNNTLVLGKPIDVVIIDYPDLMVNPFMKGSDNESRAGGMLTEEIRRIAQEYNFLGWVFSQLNRSGVASEFRSASMIEGSKQKLNPVEIAMTINQTAEEKEHGYSRLYVDKLRNQTRADFDRMLPFRYIDETMTLRDLNPQEAMEHRAILEDLEESVTGMRKQKKKKEQFTNQDVQAKVNNMNQAIQVQANFG